LGITSSLLTKSTEDGVIEINRKIIYNSLFFFFKKKKGCAYIYIHISFIYFKFDFLELAANLNYVPPWGLHVPSKGGHEVNTKFEKVKYDFCPVSKLATPLRGYRQPFECRATTRAPSPLVNIGGYFPRFTYSYFCVTLNYTAYLALGPCTRLKENVFLNIFKFFLKKNSIIEVRTAN
jgi:hypothetical protein